jgi:hypothetical protein
MKPTIDTPDRRFLEHFEPRQRGHIANLCLCQVRRGLTDANRVVLAVLRQLLEQTARCRRWGNMSTVTRNQQIVDAIQAYPDEAVDYASWAVWWESLSTQEKHRIKASKWMAQQPATDKQTKSLRALGYHGEIESKLHASERMDQQLQKGSRCRSMTPNSAVSRKIS